MKYNPQPKRTRKDIYPWPENIFKTGQIKYTVNKNLYGNFVKRFHYSKSLARGCSNTYILEDNGKVYGVAMFGMPVGKNSPGDIECKRFVLMRKAPKNVASWFMAKCIKEIKKENKFNQIVSYADSEQGHSGIMYKASNYNYLGLQKKKGQEIRFKSGEKLHLRAAYQKLNGEYTDTAKRAMSALRTGEAKYYNLKPKHIFVYKLKK